MQKYRLTVVLGLLVLLTAVLGACQQQENSGGEDRPEMATLDRSPEARLAAIKSGLDSVKMELMQAGSYNCCVQPACDWCALHEGECICYENLRAGKPVCPGCGLGWHNGEGVVPDIQSDEVQWDITHEHAADSHTH